MFLKRTKGPIRKYFIQSNLSAKNKLLGINPGASYGSAKRWYPKEFADVASDLSSKYDIVIFGGPGEKDIAADIEKYLIENGVDNLSILERQQEYAPIIVDIDIEIPIETEQDEEELLSAQQRWR